MKIRGCLTPSLRGLFEEDAQPISLGLWNLAARRE
jgi:hypothetical protein